MDEIFKLQQTIQDLRAKLSTTDYQADKKKDELIERIRLESTHLGEKMQQMKENWDREKKNNEKIINELMEELISLKIKYQTEVAEKDGNDLKHIKRIKILNYQIKLYEDQINKFNKRQ